MGGVYGVDLIIGIGVAVLHEEVVQREINLVFANVISQSVHDLASLLVPDIRLTLDKREGRLVTQLPGAAAQVFIEKWTRTLCM